MLKTFQAKQSFFLSQRGNKNKFESPSSWMAYPHHSSFFRIKWRNETRNKLHGCVYFYLPFDFFYPPLQIDMTEILSSKKIIGLRKFERFQLENWWTNLFSILHTVWGLRQSPFERMSFIMCHIDARILSKKFSSSSKCS